ncbi:MAG: restriction endonuclease subunit S [Gammaproteobacteria bacterium]|nr:restriction endonuclease subunit S [Gammaproteobacteria bacterium]
MLDKEKNRGDFFPYLGNKNVRWGSFDIDELAQMRFEENEHERYGLKDGDLVVCEGGEPGRCAIWKEQIPGMKIQKALHRIRAKEALDNRFLHYWFLWAGKTGALEPYFTGTTIKHLTGKAIAELPIPLPPLQEQKSIAYILGTLDDKIELNRQMNATLEAMAQALFKSWFVDFDPVIDNALAAGNPIPEPLQTRAEIRKALGDKRKPFPTHRDVLVSREAGGRERPEAIQQQFPNRFVFSDEMGWVPEGWEVKSIGDVIELAYGKSLPASKRIDGDVPVFGSGGISGLHNEKLVDGPGIVVGRKGTVGSLYWVEDDFFPIDTVFFVVNKSHVPLYWLYQTLGLIDIKSMGADSAVPGVNRNAVYARSVTIPRVGVFDGYLGQIESYNSRRKVLDEQSSTLTNLRDTLLPKLLSGQLRLPDAEAMVEQAAAG